ncbi:hypothetical protein PFISCL1PPCAC_180, partial [Pristionchus fissidentatus]
FPMSRIALIILFMSGEIMSGETWACQCIPSSPEDDYAQAEFVSEVFVEKVRVVREDDYIVTRTFFVKHLNIFKRPVNTSELPTTISLVGPPTTCELRLEKGEKRLLFGSIRWNSLYPSPCSQGFSDRLEGYRLATQSCGCDFRSAAAFCKSEFVSMVRVEDVIDMHRGGKLFQKMYTVKHLSTYKSPSGSEHLPVEIRIDSNHGDCANLEIGQQIILAGEVSHNLLKVASCSSFPKDFDPVNLAKTDCSKFIARSWPWI